MLGYLRKTLNAFPHWGHLNPYHTVTFRSGAPKHSFQKGFCSKAEDPNLGHKSKSQTVKSGHGISDQSLFKVPGYKPTEMDKRVLVWAGRFKSKSDVPEMVSFEMINAARNRVRIKGCYIMIFLTIMSCIGMTILGKQAVDRHESLSALNMEKKARWREEAEKEQDSPAVSKTH
ncbi:protein FAM162B [Polypterus senegalus]